jgi:hypothetical protein
MLERVPLKLAVPHVVEVQFDLGNQRGQQLPDFPRLGVLEGFPQVPENARGFLDLFII